MKSLKLRILLLTILLVKVEAQEIVLENRSPETNARTVLLKETEEREGLKYIPGKKLPFTGKIFSPYNKRLRGIETNYRRGKKHGIETTYINGLVYRTTEYNANFESGKKHGVETQYSEAGGPIWYTTQYQYGKKNGLQVEFWEDGTIRNEKQYLDDLPIGVEVGYSVNGIKTSEVPYRNGVKHGMAIENFEDGSPLNRVRWVDGEKEGKELRFQKNGNKLREKNYVNGKVQGTMTIYSEDGSKESEYFFDNGILQGVAFRYLEDGSVVEDTWEDGKKVSSTLLPPKQNSVPKKKTFQFQRLKMHRMLPKVIRFVVSNESS